MSAVPKPSRTVLEDFRGFIRLHPCCRHWPSIQPGDPVQLGQHRVQSEAAHVKSRGSGGDDARNLLPLCHWCHIHVQHLQGWGEVWAAHTSPEAGRAHAEWLAQRYWEAYQSWRRVHPPALAPAF